MFATFYHNPKKRHLFYVVLGIIALFNVIVQMVVIVSNSLSASYFTYSDDYYALYYVKPYSRMNQFLLGIIAGCFYYSYELELEDPSFFTNFLSNVQKSKTYTIVSLVIAAFLTNLMLLIL